MQQNIDDTTRTRGFFLNWQLARFPGSRWAAALACIGIALPPALCALYIYKFGVNVPFWDQWELVPLFGKLHDNTLTFADLFRQHNEHRVLFPRILMLIIGTLTHYSNRAEMFVSWLIQCFSMGVILAVVLRSEERIEWALIKFIPVSWLLFSIGQYENLLWGWQLCFFTMIFLLLLSLYFIWRSDNSGRNLYLSILCAIGASFSSANGLLIWPIGLLQIIYQGYLQNQKITRRCWLSVANWSLAAVIVCLAYFFDYEKPNGHPSLFHFIEHPIRSAAYFVTFLGNSLFTLNSEHFMDFIAAAGLLLLIPYIYAMSLIFRRNISSSAPFFISLILYSSLSGLLIVLGRAGYGVAQALSSRYTTFGMLGVIGAYLLIVICDVSVYRMVFGTMILTMLPLGLFMAYSRGVKAGQSIREARISMANHLLVFESNDDKALDNIYAHTDRVRIGAQLLESYGYNVFSQRRR